MTEIAFKLDNLNLDNAKTPTAGIDLDYKASARPVNLAGMLRSAGRVFGKVWLSGILDQTSILKFR